MQNKLKVGDIVQIMPTANAEKYRSHSGLGWGDGMPDYIGEIGTIEWVSDEYGGNGSLFEIWYTWLLEDFRLLDMQDQLNLRYNK